MKDLSIPLLATIMFLLGGVIGFLGGIQFEKNQHDRIDIRVPGFQYQQR